MTVIRWSPLERMVSAKSRCCGLSGVSSSRLVMPITAFIGVRISWLMLARNCALAAVAASATCRAFSSSRAVRSMASRASISKVTSWVVPAARTARPLALRNTRPSERIQRTPSPSGTGTRKSRLKRSPLARALSKARATRSRSSSATAARKLS